ncbi:uncharacterized oxidoreductase YrbE-like [Anneissia japonica]|uniref:uncharacterized oxidoreductase YrbE-like n=1 Tax=Anneissia japonica TaxID=1529436 RepID=UPI0014259F78|nr:uncharacterized oxidoreductase YrbE-like [Anneissia japonica]
MTSLKKVCIAIFGMGRIGQVHLENAVSNPRVWVKYIMTTNYEKTLQIKQRYHIDDSVEIVLSSDVGKILEDKSVEMVVICTSTSHHVEIIQASCKAGKAVFCEKPIALTLDDVTSCFASARENGQLLFCAYNRRFDPSIRDLYNRVKSGEIKDIISIRSTNSDQQCPPMSYLKNSGGLFFDCATHDLDIICWIMGESPSTVYCQAYALNPDVAAVGDYDTAGIMMQFSGGAIAYVDLGREAIYGYDQRLEVFGTAGMLQTLNLYPTSVQSHDHKGHSSGQIYQAWLSRYKESYRLEFEHFLDVYQGIEPELEVSEEACILAIKLSMCCEESLHSGGPVTLEME